MNLIKKQFENQNYINIETFRVNGQGVKTPVWFVQDDGSLYVRTAEGSGKVKRINKNRHILVAPCKMDGTPVNEWLPAQAVELRDPDVDKKVDHLLKSKYGFQNMIFTLNAKLKGVRYTVLKIELSSSST